MATRILIVEDEPELASLLRDILEDGGYDVVLSTGSGALSALQSTSPDGILIDYVMPGITGAEVVREMRRVQGSTPPVILVTGREDVSALAESLRADAFLRKPFDVDDLLGVVRRLTGGN